MADSAEKEKPKIVSTRPSFMFRHGEKLALGVAAALLVGYGAFSALTSDKDFLQSAGTACTKVKDPTDKYKKSVETIRTKYKDYDAQASWKNITRSAVVPRVWTMSGVSKIEVTGTEPLKPKVITTLKLPEVEIEELNSILGAVSGKFKFTPVTGKVIDPLTKIDAARLTAFKLERRTMDAKAPPAAQQWAEILKIPWDEKKPPELKFEDKSILPKTKYEYRMVAATDQKKIESPEAVQIVESPKYSDVKALRTVGYFSWKLGGITSGEQGPKINIEITKYDPQANDNFTVKFGYVQGDELGSHLDDPNSDDPKTTFEWKDVKGQKTGVKKTLNFKTGVKLLVLETGATREIPYRACPMAGGKCAGFVVKKRPWTGSHVQIVDDEGEKKDEWRPLLPVVEDRLCPEHADMKGKPFDDAPKGPDSPKPPEPPKTP